MAVQVLLDVATGKLKDGGVSQGQAAQFLLSKRIPIPKDSELKGDPDDNPRRGSRVAPGTIMLQGHDSTTDVGFRNLRVRELAKRR